MKEKKTSECKNFVLTNRAVTTMRKRKSCPDDPLGCHCCPIEMAEKIKHILRKSLAFQTRHKANTSFTFHHFTYLFCPKLASKSKQAIWLLCLSVHKGYTIWTDDG